MARWLDRRACWLRLSPLLAFNGATPLADSSDRVDGRGRRVDVAAGGEAFELALGVGRRLDDRSIVLAARQRSAAGLLVGPSLYSSCCAQLARVDCAWRERSRSALCCLLLPSWYATPLRFMPFCRAGLGVGTNLWEGIGETERAAEFGAVFSDAKLIEQERAEMGLAPDAPLGLYWPDGLERDRARMRKRARCYQAASLLVCGRDDASHVGLSELCRRAFDLLRLRGNQCDEPEMPAARDAGRRARLLRQYPGNDSKRLASRCAAP